MLVHINLLFVCVYLKCFFLIIPFMLIDCIIFVIVMLPTVRYGVVSLDKAMEVSMYGALENVIDPELGIDIVNLGLVYGVNLDDEGNAGVEMTLTSMGCPMGPQIMGQVEHSLLELPEVKDVQIAIVWNPPWDKDKMTRYAKIALGVS